MPGKENQLRDCAGDGTRAAAHDRSAGNHAARRPLVFDGADVR